jgi:hypothetical protein
MDSGKRKSEFWNLNCLYKLKILDSRVLSHHIQGFTWSRGCVLWAIRLESEIDTHDFCHQRIIRYQVMGVNAEKSIKIPRGGPDVWFIRGGLEIDSGKQLIGARRRRDRLISAGSRYGVRL